MNDQISWDLEVAILPGQLDNFRAVARDLIAATEPEPGALSYEYKLSNDGTACHIYERYQNSAAVLAHVESFHHFAERFMQTCHPTSLHIYGTPSDEVKAEFADLHPVYFTWFGGFNR